jgi:hypothetical protein
MRKFLAWLQKPIKHWIKPAPPLLISELLSDLTRSRTDLVVENALLCQQLIVLKRQVKQPCNRSYLLNISGSLDTRTDAFG